MLKLPSLGEMDRGMGTKIYLCVSATDMRKGFDSLAAMVRDHHGHDPLSGHLFLFVGRHRDRIKMLYWDSDGYALWYKRLEEGTFRLPRSGGGTPASGGASGGEPRGGASVELKASELAMLLEGIDLTSIKRRRRFNPPAPVAPKSQKN